MSPSMINSMLDDLIFFRNMFAGGGNYIPIPSKQDVQYPVEVKYNDDEIVFEYAVAGIPKDDISVEVEEDTLIVSYNKKEQADDQYTVLFSGITRKEFRHVWKVNPVFDMEKTIVHYSDGILKVSIPRKPEKKKRVLEF